jgi:hypothetical protein
MMMTVQMTDRIAPLTSADVRQVCGDLTDWKVSAILDTHATIGDLEAAVAWLEGEDDVMGEERRPLSGASAQIYDLLVADEAFPGEDRAR